MLYQCFVFAWRAACKSLFVILVEYNNYCATFFFSGHLKPRLLGLNKLVCKWYNSDVTCIISINKKLCETQAVLVKCLENATDEHHKCQVNGMVFTFLTCAAWVRKSVCTPPPPPNVVPYCHDVKQKCCTWAVTAHLDLTERNIVIASYFARFPRYPASYKNWITCRSACLLCLITRQLWPTISDQAFRARFVGSNQGKSIRLFKI